MDPKNNGDPPPKDANGESDVQRGSEDNSEDSDYNLGYEHGDSEDYSGDSVMVDSDEDELAEGSRDKDRAGVGEDELAVQSYEDLINDDSGESDLGESEDDFNSAKESDSEKEGHKCPIYKQRVVYDPHIELNMIFSTKRELIDAVHSNAAVNKRVIKITKNDRGRVHAKCQGDGCDWKVHGFNIPGESTFQIRTYIPTHSCPESFHVKSIKSRWLTGRYGYRFKNDPKKRGSVFKNDMSVELGVDITNYQAYTCKKLALKDQYGNIDEQYKLLWDYAQEIRRTNPGSTVIIGSDDSSGSHRFDRMYICLRAVKEGFLIGCRPLIGVDGCHLKGPHKGILLSAVGVDPNNNMYPIAYVVVSKETLDTWEWFLTVLKADLEIIDDTIWTFISDKQKGLVQAFQNIFPNSSHRFCVRHLHGNMRNAGFRGQAFKIALYRASKATTLNDFNRKMYEMSEIGEAAVQWLSDKPPQQWSRSHFNCIPRSDMVMNNLCESYNSSILPAREMPILSMLEWLMEHLIKRFQKNRDLANRGRKWKGLLCPKIQNEINESVKHIGRCIPTKASDKHYQIRCIDGTQFSVDLEKLTCGCRRWDLSGIPCTHAIRAIYCQGLKPEDFTNALYRVNTYRMVYDSCIMPINGRLEWLPTEIEPLLPPLIGRQAGRPKKARRREPDEPAQKKKKKTRGKPTSNPYRAKRSQVTLRCSNCHQTGHNKRRCENPPVENATKENPPHVENVIEENANEENLGTCIGDENPVEYSQTYTQMLLSQVINAPVSQKTVLKEPPPMYDQLLQRQRSEDEAHVFTKAGKSFVTM